ncbi:MAG: hypothetical protein EOM15_02890 [Spirochaetia bacterium]|nr:hypothetical protein [Spirochaetia bacterium]
MLRGRYFLHMKRKQSMAFPYRQRALLHIHISTESFEIVPLSQEEGKSFLGGRLLALKLWQQYAEYDKLEEKQYESGNPIVFAPGAASDLLMPCCSSYTVVTKSPVTGQLAINSSSSSLANAILGCGYSAIVITGRSRRLCGFSITNGSVQFHDAEVLHDMTTTAVSRYLGAEHLVTIGPAGERFVDHASLYANGQNVTRCGVGKVFGLKNLKYFTLAPQVDGRNSYDPEQMGLLSQVLQKELEKSDIGRVMATEGPIALLSKANHHGWAAIDNYSMRIDGRLWGLCPRNRVQPDSSKHPLSSCCEHASAINLESALALGSNLELYDGRSVGQLVVRCLENGLDPVSCGAAISWARHCRMDGRLSFLPDMRTPSAILYLRLLDAMSFQRGGGEELGKNLGALVATYGGEEHAYMVDGLELPPFDYRALPVQALLASMGDTSLVFGELLWGNHYHRGNERLLASWALYTQYLYGAMESVGLCPYLSLPLFTHPLLHFPRWKAKRKILSRLATVASLSEGYEITPMMMLDLGKKTLSLKHDIEEKILGRKPGYGSLPDQLLINGKSNFRAPQVVPLVRLLDAYWSLLKGKKY